VKWAEVSDSLFVTFEVSDAHDAKVACTEDSISFNCTSGKDTYSCDLKLKGKILPDDEETKWVITGRHVECHLKKDESERWDCLLADKKLGKNLVFADFDRWIDSDDEGEGKEFDMGGMGGGGGMGMGGPPGMGGMGGMPGMGGMGGMPGMGGMGGMPGMGGGMPGMGGMGGMPGMGGEGGMDMAKLQEMMAQMKEGGAGGMPGGEAGEDGEDGEDSDDLPDLEDAEQ